MKNERFAPLMEINARPDLVFVAGRGSWLEDEAGSRYLDFVQGWAVNTLGHCPPELVFALTRQAATLINPSPGFYNAPALRLAQLIIRHCALDRVFFANSGAEANEGAIKLARKWGQLRRSGAYEIVTLQNGFHGRTLATMAASGKAGWDRLFPPAIDGFVKVPLNDLGALEAALGEQTVAVMLEPIQGEAGVLPAAESYLRGVRDLTRDRGILMIIDEVQTGVGRTGKPFAHQHFAIQPDIMTLGKGLGGGVPLAALVAREDVCCFEHGDQGGTFNGNPLMTAVGCAVMETVTRPGFLRGVSAAGDYLAQRLGEMSRKHGLGEVRGLGLLRALATGPERDGGEIVARARQRGLLLNAPRPDCLRFMPALNVTRDEIDLMAETLDSILAEMGEKRPAPRNGDRRTGDRV